MENKMLNKIHCLILVIFLFSFPLLSKTIIVDQNGNGEYLKINDALNIAIDGDSICVRVGIYNERINIYKQVTLYSDNYENTIITHSTICIAIYSTNVTVQGFTIMSNGSDIGINIGDFNNITIKNNFVTNCGNGINISGVGVKLISNNIVSDSEFGIYDNSTATILNNLIHQNTNGIYSNSNGMYAYNNIVINNINGISAKGSMTNLFYNCVWSNTNNYVSCSSGLGDISVDPNFYDYENNDFRLRPNSPCIDAGYPSNEYNDPNATRNDMGIHGGPHSWRGLGPIITNLEVTPQSVIQGETINISATATLE
ncbi:MAG: hypothetical protein GF353_13920 [Candidatus Lokiarchaeota archaeon]|nr:hypothetical protein [Candidatus Lokiarchaeota archaeon]